MADLPVALLNNPEFTPHAPADPGTVRTFVHGGMTSLSHACADRGPVVRTTRTTTWNDSTHRWNTVTQFWVVSEVLVLASGAVLFSGVKLTAKGEADRRGISSIGGMHTRHLFLGRHEAPEVVGFLRGTWGRA